MINKVINDDVFKTKYKHIAFAVNTEGFNDAGFAGQVSGKYAPQLANTGEKKLGEIITVDAKGKNFHALVCHSLKEGWGESPSAITKALDSIQTENDEPVAVVLMGAGMIGQMSGADVVANIQAIHASKKNCTVYTLQYTKEAVMDVLK